MIKKKTKLTILRTFTDFIAKFIHRRIEFYLKSVFALNDRGKIVIWEKVDLFVILIFSFGPDRLKV